jgi:hypothetical protein
MNVSRPHPFLVGFPTVPPGGTALVGTVLGPPDTRGTAAEWTDAFTPVFEALYGITLFRGSLNLRLDPPVEWEDPFSLDVGGRHWEFCPVVVAEREAGVAFRGNRDFPNLLEIASTVHLRSALGGLADGDAVPVRILPGWDLKPAP